MNILLAVPSCFPGGLDVEMDKHFGRCDIYTLVEIEDDKIKKVTNLPNLPNRQCGSLAPVQMLAQNGVKTMLVGGIGFRPLMASHQLGIDVFSAVGVRTVGMGVQAFLKGKLSAFSEEFACRDGRC